MGTFALRARMLNGTYTGHQADGSPDELPDPARLYSALVQSACTGSTAEWHDGRLVPSDAGRAALEWLENNPPDGLQIPRSVSLTSEPPVAYRKEGLIRKEVGATVDKTSGKATSDGVAVDGAYAYTWIGDVPAEVREALDALCADVSHLGEALSPVVLETEDVTTEGQHAHGEWIRDERVSRFTPGGRRVRIPLPGRFDELEQAHRENNPRKSPSAAKDKHKTSEDSVRAEVPRERVQQQRYVLPRSFDTTLPWSHAIAISVDALRRHDGEPAGGAEDIPADQRVGWCVALHRALARRIGGAAPPMITGRYGSAVEQPPNRLALQYVDRTTLQATQHSHIAGAGGAFLLLVPGDVAGDDLLALEHALVGLSELRSRYGVASVHVSHRQVPCRAFWKPPAEGMLRCWTTSPAMVSDVRPQGKTWTLRDSALTAVGFTWRGVQGMDGAMAAPGNKYRNLVAYVEERFGTRVLTAHRLVGDGSRYVHKLPPGGVAEPFTAVLQVDAEQMPPEALVAVGQTRHLGGGLLVPVDMPASALELTWGGTDD